MHGIAGTLYTAWTSCTHSQEKQALVDEIAKILPHIKAAEAEGLPEKDTETRSMSTGAFGSMRRWMRC